VQHRRRRGIEQSVTRGIKIAQAALILALLPTTILAATSPTERKFEGKTVSEWAGHLISSRGSRPGIGGCATDLDWVWAADDKDAERALRQMGEDAIN
jgi:hypothetical protein